MPPDLAPVSRAPPRSAPVRLVPATLASVRLASVRLVPVSVAVARLALVRLALVRLVVVRNAPVRLALIEIGPREICSGTDKVTGDRFPVRRKRGRGSRDPARDHPFEDCIPEDGIRQDRSNETGVPQVGPVQVCVGEVCAGELCIGKVQTSQTRTSEVGARTEGVVPWGGAGHDGAAIDHFRRSRRYGRGPRRHAGSEHHDRTSHQYAQCHNPPPHSPHGHPLIARPVGQPNAGYDNQTAASRSPCTSGFAGCLRKKCIHHSGAGYHNRWFLPIGHLLGYARVSTTDQDPALVDHAAWSGFVVHGTEHLAVAVAPPRVVPGLDPLEDGLGELLAALPVVLVEQLELEGAEEALGDGIVSRPAERRRRPNAHDV